MRNLQIAVVSLFLAVAIAFSVYFCYDWLMVDHTAPQIICDGAPLYVSVHSTDRELCAGLTAQDDVDGDITDRIVVRRISQLYGSNNAAVYYAVFDSSSNFCTYSRPVFYTDYCRPRFQLSQPLSFATYSTVTLMDRLSATDALDGDITQRIRISSTRVNTSEPGAYPVTVQVTNSSGDTSAVDLTVVIENTTSRHPVIRLSEYIHYIRVTEELTEDTLRSLIAGARTSTNGRELDPDDIEITGEADTSKRGSYQVEFSYTNEQKLTRTVFLTVVVE